MAKRRVLTHHTRENTCPHPVQKSKTKLKWQITELHTHTTLVRLVPSRHHTWTCEAPKDARRQGSQGLQDTGFRRGNQQRHWKQDPFELLSRGTGRQAEAAAWRLWDLLLSFLPLFSTQDIVHQCHGGGESQTGCFGCMILAVTSKQAKRSKTTLVLSCTAPTIQV